MNVPRIWENLKQYTQTPEPVLGWFAQQQMVNLLFHNKDGYTFPQIVNKIVSVESKKSTFEKELREYLPALKEVGVVELVRNFYRLTAEFRLYCMDKEPTSTSVGSGKFNPDLDPDLYSQLRRYCNHEILPLSHGGPKSMTLAMSYVVKSLYRSGSPVMIKTLSLIIHEGEWSSLGNIKLVLDFLETHGIAQKRHVDHHEKKRVESGSEYEQSYILTDDWMKFLKGQFSTTVPLLEGSVKIKGVEVPANQFAKILRAAKLIRVQREIDSENTFHQYSIDIGGVVLTAEDLVELDKLTD